MGLMLSRVFMILALCLALVSCKSLVEKYERSESGVSAVNKKVLFDFRQPLPPSSTAASCPVAPPSCSQLMGGANGSFTYAAENEQACLYRCVSTNKLQIWSTGKLQATGDTPFASVLRVFDLNHDDKNELLLSTETAKDGVTDREASLMDFDKNVLHPVEDFGTVYHNPCGLFAGADETKKKALLAGGRTPFIDAVVMYYLPRPEHEMPSFTAERYRAPCSDLTQWQRVGAR